MTSRLAMEEDVSVVGHKKRDAAARQARLDELAHDPNLPTVREFLGRYVDMSGRPQCHIAAEAGFTSPQMFNMVLKGRVRLPLDRLEPVAEVLGIDAAQLLRIWFNEYHPATLRLIERRLCASGTAAP